MFEDDDDRQYEVVRNDEEQYSLWPTGRTLPPGWIAVGMTGVKSECLDYIKRVWTDMRPRSLRERKGA
jgi:MbtH protein